MSVIKPTEQTWPNESKSNQGQFFTNSSLTANCKKQQPTCTRSKNLFK